MADYTDLVKFLRGLSPWAFPQASNKRMQDAADAIEALNRLLDQNTQRCEALRKQLREAHESYERHLNELESQLPKRGEWKRDEKRWGENSIRCSLCGAVIEDEEWGWRNWNYCYHCGAKMMEVQDG